MGKVVLIAGLIIAGIGLLMMAGVPFGRLPGDIMLRRGNTSFYFPIATSIVVSIILSLVFAAFRR